MKVVELLKLFREPLKMLSKTESNVNDWQYVEMFDEYAVMKSHGVKTRSIASELSERYGIGKSTVYKVINRLSREC